MKKIILGITTFCLIFAMLFCQKTYAKYKLNGSLAMDVYIDKTPPIIDVTDKTGNTESFPKTQTDVVKRTDDVTLDTRDNIKIAYNEYYYNPMDNNFDGKTPTRFNNGKELTDEGYYKIVAVDTSGNITEIVILIDKTPPEVTVKFYKKSEISLLKTSESDKYMKERRCGKQWLRKK